MSGRVWRNRTLVHCWWEGEMTQLLWKMVRWFLEKTESGIIMRFVICTSG